MLNFHFETNGPEQIEFAGQNGVNGYAGVSFYRQAIAPRIGFALDVFGTGATMLRGGFSKAYDPGSTSTTGALARNPPYASRLDLINGTFQLGPISPTVFLPSMRPTRPSTRLDPATTSRMRISGDLRSSSVCPPGLRLKSRARAPWAPICMRVTTPINRIRRRRPTRTARYPFEPYHGRVDYLDLAGGSTYYGGQLKLSGQPTAGLQFTMTYLYAKSIDDSTAPEPNRTAVLRVRNISMRCAPCVRFLPSIFRRG